MTIPDTTEAVARAIEWTTLTDKGKSECKWPNDFSYNELVDMREKAHAAIAAHEAALEAAGWVRVPVEPTRDMKFAAAHLKGVRVANRLIKPNSAEVWQAMIAARPK